MIKKIFQALVVIEYVIRFVNHRRAEIAREQLEHELVQAISKAKTTKDTSDLEKLLNNSGMKSE